MPRPSKIEPVLIRPEAWLKRSSPPLGSQEGHYFGVDCVIIRYSTDEIGEGPNLHVHPYDEIFHILEGRAQFTVGERHFEATAGSLVIGPANVPHAYELRAATRVIAKHLVPDVKTGDRFANVFDHTREVIPRDAGRWL